MDSYRTELKRKFPRLDVTHDVTAASFIAAGYTGTTWPSTGGQTDIRKFIEAMNWCLDNMPDSSCHIANVFWFASKEDAMQFALRFL